MRRLGLPSVESVAARFLEHLGLDRAADYLDPFAAFSALGLTPCATAPSGCHGALDLERRRVHVRWGKHVAARHSCAGHELGHVAQLADGIALPHVEYSTTLVGLALRIPHWSVQRSVAEVGLHPERLAERWPQMYPSEIFTRVMMHLRGWVVFDPLRASHVVANDNAPPLDVLMRASPLCQAVRLQGGTLSGPGNIVAGEYRDPGRRVGVVALVPPLLED